MLYRVLLTLAIAAFILAGCEDDGDGFHKDPERGYITIIGPHSVGSVGCGGEFLYADYFDVYLNDSSGRPLSDFLVSITTDQYLVLIDQSDSASYTNDSGFVKVEIGSNAFGDGFWFQVVAAGDTEVFVLSIMENFGFPASGQVEPASDTLYVHSGQLDSIEIRASLRNGFGESLPGSLVWFSTSAGQIDSSAQVFESHDYSIYWYPPEPAQLDDVFVYARFGYWCVQLHDSTLITLNDTTSFIVYPTP